MCGELKKERKKKKKKEKKEEINYRDKERKKKGILHGLSRVSLKVGSS